MLSELKCPGPNTLEDLIANRLPAAKAEAVRDHLAACPTCTPPRGTGEKPFGFLQPPRTAGEIARLGDYSILGVLGEGGMAIVFEAEDGRLHRKVALKVLRPEKCSAEMKQRFLREARVLASLPHEHVVAVFAVEEADGVPYMAMEKLEGRTLEERLVQDHSLPLDESLSIARQVAEGLQAVHGEDLVHRDVKPANIWLETTPDGRSRQVKLLDFGIARRTSDDKGLTASGQIIGTPAYMAPEQAMGLPADRRADLYGLGCVMYRMLTGKPPFEGKPGETMAVLEAVVKNEAPPIGAAAPHLPAGVARLIQRLLARAPSERPGSASELVSELRRLEAEPGAAVAAPPKRVEPTRRPWTLSIVIGASAALAALLVGAATLYYALLPPRDSNGGFSGPPIKVGLLHSTHGPLSFHERQMLNALEFAIKDVNAAGGVLGREVVGVFRDGDSDEETFGRAAEDLIVNEEVVALFGCWSAASRKRVEKVCEDRGTLLFFSAGYEGLEDSRAVVYLGGTPNQTLIPLVQWAYVEKKKKKFLLLGSEDVYSRSVNEMLRHELESLGATYVGQINQPVGDDDFSKVVATVIEKEVEFIVNTIDGPVNALLLSALRAKGLRPGGLPRPVWTAWASLSESELTQFDVRGDLLGDYGVGTYFESLDTERNREFVARYKGSNKGERVSDAMETSYVAVHLWKKAVEKARSTATTPVRDALSGMDVDGPEGTIQLADSRHAKRTPRVGRIAVVKDVPQFDVVYEPASPVLPEAYPYREWRSRDQWQGFLDGLRKEWGGKWEKRKPR